jgi:mannose-6-phosphate isomerase-like protein (cupin superfamily)
MSDFARHTEGEMFYVVSGKGSMRVGDETLPITPGDAVWVPGETAHQMENTGQVVLKVLWVLSPPGREADILRPCELARLDPKGHE